MITQRMLSAARAIANMTLYNFGKREGNVQAARETLDATKYDYETTNSRYRAIDQAGLLRISQHPRRFVTVRQATVKSRDQLVARSKRVLREVGTRAKIDVARAGSERWPARKPI